MMVTNTAVVSAVDIGAAMPHLRGRPNGRCLICTHAERLKLEILLAGGASQASVARKYELSPDALGRHWRDHVTEERRANLVLGPVQRQALSARVAEESTSVLDQLRITRSGLFQTYDVALTAGDRNAVALLAGRLHENLRDVARLTGELASSPLVTINNSQTTITALLDSPQFAEFESKLLRILQRHPAALADVLREFERLERSGAPAIGASPLPALEHAHAAD